MCIRDRFITADELKKRIGEARAMKHRLRFDLMRETNRIDKEELELFEYKMCIRDSCKVSACILQCHCIPFAASLHTYLQ